MIVLQLAVLLICIFIGARMSGIGLGVMGMIGLLILMFGFGLQPADPPLEVMLIILSVVTAAAALQAAGGMDYLVEVAGKIQNRLRFSARLSRTGLCCLPARPIFRIQSCPLLLR